MKRTIQTGHNLPFEAFQQGIEVLTPHRRAADAIEVPRRTLEDAAWLTLTRAGLKHADATERHLRLCLAVSEFSKQVDASAGAGWLRPSIEALLRSGTDPSDLIDDVSERVRQMATIAARYLELLREEDLVDPAQALWRASEALPERKAVVVYGYFRPRIDELEFIDALAGDGSHFILPAGEDSIFNGNNQAIEHLRKLGWEVAQSEPSSGTYGQKVADGFAKGGGGCEVKAYFFPNLEGEVRGVLASVKELLLDGVPAGEIVIAARDERLYGPVLEAIGWEYGSPINLLYKITLDETRFGNWMKLLLEAMTGGFEFEPVARLMSHSLGPGLSDDAWKKSRKLHTAGLESWANAGVDLSDLNWPEKASRKEFTGLLSGALDRYALKKRSGSWTRELTAYNLFYGSIDTLHFNAPDEGITLEQFAGDMRDLLSTLMVSYQPGGGGIEVHAPQSLFGANYRHVFVVGMAEGIVPAPIVQDPVLDFFERKRLIGKGIRLDSAADVARREALTFHLMLCAATERITLSYPLLIGRDAMLPSPFLKRMGIEADRGERATLASAEEARKVMLRDGAFTVEDEVRDFALHSLTVEERRESPGPYDEYDGMTGRSLNAEDRVWSASQLTALGQCPFKWYAMKVLGIVEPEEMELELTPALRGSLYHKALELAIEPEVDNPRATALDRLDEAFLRAETEIGIPRLPAWYAQRREHIAKLKRAIESEAFISEGAIVIGTETGFTGEWFGLRVNGLIDRIDRTADGIVMTDYKAGSTAPPGVKDERGLAQIDIQLPLYIQAAGNAMYPGQRVTGAYYSLRKAEVLKKPEGEDTGQLEEFAGRVRKHLKKGAYPVDPDNKGYACSFCDYDAVCRRGDRLSWKVRG